MYRGKGNSSKGERYVTKTGRRRDGLKYRDLGVRIMAKIDAQNKEKEDNGRG